MRIRILIILMLTIMGTCFVACTPNTKHIERTLDFFSMNTIINMIAYGDNAEEALIAARSRTLELENKWSVRLDTSDVYTINHANGTTVAVSEDTVKLINFSLEMARKTEGAFEPSIYPIVSLWGFTTHEFYVPTEEEITATLDLIGYEKVQTNDNLITLEQGMSLDFGAVGKGYALDEVIEILKMSGITSALINFGGNIGMIGDKPNGDKWQIGVVNPQGGDYLGVLSLSNCAIATSGNYQNYFEVNGERYGHIMNPLTGRPQSSDIISVTVVAADGKLCDALATAIYVMGVDAAIELWRIEGNFELLLIMNDGRAFVTEDLIQNFSAAEVLIVEKILK